MIDKKASVKKSLLFLKITAITLTSIGSGNSNLLFADTFSISAPIFSTIKSGTVQYNELLDECSGPSYPLLRSREYFCSNI